MINDRFWLWMQRVFPPGSNVSEIVAYFGGAKKLFLSNETERLDSRLFGNDLINISTDKLRRLASEAIENSDSVINYCKNEGISIITPEDKLYPRSLLSLPNYPLLLFARGNADCLSSGNIFAVIGTRNPSDYGRQACSAIVRDMVLNGSTIVSGGALGIDSVAHSACVNENSPTILVMGNGLDYKYLMKNKPLRDSIIETGGCLISEYTPLESGTISSFPMRNRIVASLAEGIVVFEAGERSGTLNTCFHAQKLGKPIFVLPGSVDSPLYAGSNRLIDDGALPIFSAESIYRYFDREIRHRTRFETPKEPFEGIDTYDKSDGLTGIPRTERLARQKKNASVDEKLNVTAKSNSNVQPRLNGKSSEAIMRTPVQAAPEPDFSGLSADAALAYSALKSGKCTLDEIIQQTKLSPPAAMTALTELEIEGFVETTDSANYRLIS